MRLDTTETLHTEQRPDVWRGNADTAGWPGCVTGGGGLLSRVLMCNLVDPKRDVCYDVCSQASQFHVYLLCFNA